MILLYLLAWIPMVLIAIVNGIIRETTYGKYLRELQSHQVSTLTAVVVLGFYMWGLTYFLPSTSSFQALAMGIIWLGLTVIFEFTFGHYVAKQSWQKLLEDYNLLAGRVWVIVLLWIMTAPLLFYHLH
ncbi:conserved hypothetical protein [Rippkaea orientalis PCC 8801]|uniref:Uncharacterized protein n=1 Tax=Rippkaea orientalis (strain PCC 8801 / RF-1) TaxID=41431 RepID=B7JX45_RIPO1|nr:hypothetical protein [Rippkaea orientalis]ACK67033.1 conserved hypothetical protein [Rippkaea orientalis PCC 8801]